MPLLRIKAAHFRLRLFLAIVDMPTPSGRQSENLR